MDIGVIEEIVNSIKEEPQDTNTIYGAEVAYVDGDGRPWVYLAGSTKETPVERASAEVKRGDYVNVEWRNNKLYIAGNYSNPSAGITRVVHVEQTADQAQADATAASSAASAASEAASSAVQSAATAAEAAETATNSLKSVVSGATTVEKAVSVMQTALEAVVDYDPSTDTTKEYFWHDANGAHVLGTSGAYRNDITSTGMKIMDTSTETRVATFGASMAQIGQNGAAHISILPTGLKIGGESGVECFEIESTNGTGESIFETYSVLQEGDASVSVDLTGETWWNPVSNSELVVSCVLKSVYTGEYMSEVVQMEFVYGQSSTETKQATVGGRVCTFTGVYDGGGEFDCTVNANAIFVFQSIGLYRPTSAFSPAFGFGTRQIGSTNAYGGYSSSFGVGLIPSGTMQTVVGKYNEEDANSDYVFIVGKGASNNSRSNAMAVDWFGNLEAAGDITDGTGNVLSDKIDASALADYVISQGTSGDWRYRKWHSGKIEAWFEGTFSCAASTTARGALYYSTWSLTIPSAIGFTATPNTLIGNTGDSNTVIAVNGAATSKTAMSGKVWRYASSSSALTISAKIYAWQD